MNDFTHPESERVLARLRDGDFGTTPLAQTQGRDEVFGGRFANDAIRLLQSGAPTERVGSYHSAEQMSAELYRVRDKEDFRQLLIVRRGDDLEDIAGGRHVVTPMLSLPTNPIARAFLAVQGFALGVSTLDMARNISTFRRAAPWTHAVMNALELSIEAVWPERDNKMGMSSGGRVGKKGFYAVGTTQARWTQVDGAQRARILAVVGSAVARLYGLVQPDRRSSEMIVGIQEIQPQAEGRIVMSLVPGPYLAQTAVTTRAWRSDSSTSEVM